MSTIGAKMAKISGIGIYIPRYRIEAPEINKAWNRPGGRGQKSVAGPDEDVLTMGVRAAKHCIKNAGIHASELDGIYFCSVSSGYSEYALAAQVAAVLGAGEDVSAIDFGLSTRVIGSALISAADAVDSGRLEKVLLIGSDNLKAKPGSAYELNCGAGAGAVLISKEGFAEISKTASCTTNFIGRSKREGAFHGLVDDRFVMKHSFIAECWAAKANLDAAEQIDRYVIQAPDARWSGRLLKTLKANPESLASSASHIGYAGCGSFLIDLAHALEGATEGQNIIGISYGPGGSDAVLLSVEGTDASPTLEEATGETKMLSYAEYLRYAGLIGD